MTTPPEQPNATPQVTTKEKLETDSPAGAAPDPQEATPRTDAFMFVGDAGWLEPTEAEYERLAAHARSLEREAAALRTDLEYYKAKWEHELSTVSALTHERDALREHNSSLASSYETMVTALKEQLAAEVEARRVAEDKALRVVRGDFGQICSYCGWESAQDGASWEELQAHIHVCEKHPVSAFKQRAEQAEAKAREDAKDAARYRWLRRLDHFSHANTLLDVVGIDTLDAAIDAAITERGGG